MQDHAGCLTPAARGGHRSRVLLPLLPPKTSLYVYGSLSASSPHVVEPDCSADPGIWSDLHLWGSNRPKYSHGRYVWICGTSSRPHPSRFLHLEHTPSGGPSTPRATCIPIISASHGEGHLAEGLYRQAGSGYEGYSTTGSNAIGSKIASPTAAGSSDGATHVQPLPPSRSRPATPYQQVVQLPVKPKGRGVTFNSSADKAVAIGSQDTDGHGRQTTHDQDDKTQPTSSGRVACERSSGRTIGKQIPCQVREHPSGTARKAPRDSTLGSTLHQCSSSTRAPKDPLRHVACFRSQGWRKDLDLIFKAYYRYNFSSFKESEWSRIRDKVLDHLLPLQEEWRDIKKMTPPIHALHGGAVLCCYQDPAERAG